MPFTKQYLKNLCISEFTYAKGSAYVDENRVRIISDTYLTGEQRLINASVKGSNGQYYQTELVVSPNKSTINSCNCTCPAFNKYSGACKHIIALALMADDSASNDALFAAKTDSVAVHMLRQYALKTMLEVKPITTGVKLIAVLNIEEHTPCLSFKIGTDRMYLIKDIAQFVNAVSNGESFTYGKQLSFVHSINAFNEQSARLVHFVLTYYHSYNYAYSSDYFYGTADRNRKMYLPPFMLDAFLELYDDDVVTVLQDGKENNFHIKYENPHLRLNINKQKSENFSLHMAQDFAAIWGDACVYIVLNEEIYVCDEEYSEATKALINSIMLSKTHKLSVSKNDMPMLAAMVLPELRPYLEINSSTAITEFEPPALQSKVYFDMPNPNLITVRLEHYYGEDMHLGFENKDIRTALDLKGETRIENILRYYFKEKGAKGELKIENDENAIYELVQSGIGEISEISEILATDAFKAMRAKPSASVSVGVRVESNLLRLHFDVNGIDIQELEQVLASYRKAKKFHRLRDGSFLNLEDSSLSEFSELAQGMDLKIKDIMSGDLSVPKYRALYLDALLKSSERLQYDRDTGFKQIVRDIRNVSDADYHIPQSLHHILRNYQKTGYRWMRTIAAYGFGGILADDMGLGKTVQVLAILLAQKEEQKEHTISLVVCPSSLVLNWESEARKFAPTLIAVPITGSASLREETVQAKRDTVDVFITSYDSLKRDVELYSNMKFQYLVADEAQYMKNQNTQNAKAMKTLQASVRLALTGTPVENSLAEVWSIFDFLMPGYLYYYAKFRKNFETPIVKDNDENAAKSLRKMVSPFILRRMKNDVLKELPPKIETVLYAELTGEQKKLYIANAAVARNEIYSKIGDSGTDKLQILAYITRMRQICCDPCLVYDDYTDGSAKLELCMELLQSCIESGHRVLLFSQFTSMLRRIAQRLNANKTQYYTITGETKVSSRLELVNNFNNGNIPVFLISLKAGGTGLNLTGADVVIHYDPWWNNSAQNQASDRAHRIGQTKTVQVYKLIVKETLEQRILDMQKNKSDLADMIVKEGDGAFAHMSKEEILSLFQ